MYDILETHPICNIAPERTDKYLRRHVFKADGGNYAVRVG
jgi:hypothetical protein